MRFLINFLPFLFAVPLAATPAPDFTVTTSDGVTRQLYADYVQQNKVLVFEIFFIACPPCATHAPHFQTLYQQMQAAHPGQVEFMLLSRLQSDLNSQVASYLTSKNMTMPAAGADGGSVTAVQPYTSSQFGTFLGTPTFVVIAPGTGEVHFDIRGSSPANTMALLQQKIEQLLPAPPAPCTLTSYFDNPIDSVTLTVTTTAGVETTVLATGGTYSLAGIPGLQNTSYTITPSKSSNLLDGLSTFDLLNVSRDILGIAPFPYPWQLLAADLNCSGSVSAFDIVLGRQVILGMTNVIPCGFSWRFVPATITVQNGGCADLKGIRMGDVTGPY